MRADDRRAHGAASLHCAVGWAEDAGADAGSGAECWNERDTLARVTRPPELLPAYGWRARIGFLQPGGANPHHPYEFYMLAPDGLSITLISLHSVDDEALESCYRKGRTTVSRAPGKPIW